MPPRNRFSDFPQGKFIDPAFLAQLQAEQRGLRDLLKDTRRERRFTRQDTRTELKGIRRAGQRTAEDLRTQRERGVGDIRLGAERGREDFGTQLTNLIQGYQTLGRQQQQAGAAQGLVGGSFGAASEAARAANLTRERQPIDTGVQRLGEDETRDIGRLREDVSLGLLRNRQDTRLGIAQTRRQRRRTLRDIMLERRRGRREFAASAPSIAAQAKFQGGLLRRSLGSYGGR